MTEINKNSSVLKDKVLLINKTFVGDDINKALEGYTYKYEIKSLDEIVRLMNDHADKYCYFVLKESYAGHGMYNHDITIYDLSNCKVIYFDPMSPRDKAFKAISKTVDHSQ